MKKNPTHYDQKSNLSRTPSPRLQEKQNINITLTGLFQGLHMIENAEKHNFIKN